MPTLPHCDAVFLNRINALASSLLIASVFWSSSVFPSLAISSSSALENPPLPTPAW